MSTSEQQSETGRSILAVNAGSSSIKFGMFSATDPIAQVFAGGITGIGTDAATFKVCETSSGDALCREFCIPDRVTAVNVLADWLTERIAPGALAAIAHRIVDGAPSERRTAVIDRPLLAALYDSAPDVPEHLPLELHLIETLRRKFIGTAHIACFDSWFHLSMPRIAHLLPLPRKYEAMGLKRYGFHGLSCAFLMKELERVAGAPAATGKIVIAHLGGGASVTAVRMGHSCDTTMGMTPGGGIMMGSRSGDLDPGVGWFLVRHAEMTPASFNHVANHESGMLGISETSGDVQVLLARQATDHRAAEALDLFCYQARKGVASMAAAIEGIDTLIFAGGIGEHCAEIRARICAPLAFLGVVLDPNRNGSGAGLVSSEESRVAVRVLHTDEQWMLAEEARLLLSQAEHRAPGACVP